MLQLKALGNYRAVLLEHVEDSGNPESAERSRPSVGCYTFIGITCLGPCVPSAHVVSMIASVDLVGEWLSLVEHLVRDQGVGGSNPLSPTNFFKNLKRTSGFPSTAL